MLAFSLQSGSNGNCIYVETGGVRLLFDAGINGVQAEKKLAARGRSINNIDALIISHDHADHVRYAGIFQRKFRIPLYITEKTLQASSRRLSIGKLNDVRHFSSDGKIDLGKVTVHSMPTPHDSDDSAAFIVESGGKRLGIMTDLGHVFDGLADAVSSLDAVFLESNYDPDMLAKGPYTAFLKKRIKGPEGHLSNMEAAELVGNASREGLKWACLCHLSEQNNRASVAIATHRRIIGRDLPLHIASRYAPSDILTI